VQKADQTRTTRPPARMPQQPERWRLRFTSIGVAGVAAARTLDRQPIAGGFPSGVPERVAHAVLVLHRSRDAMHRMTFRLSAWLVPLGGRRAVTLREAYGASRPGRASRFSTGLPEE
jgi:hypothetical protein